MFATVLRLLVSSSCGTKTCAWNKPAALGTLYKKTNINVIREFHEVIGDHINTAHVKGITHLRDPRLNKGLGFTLEERQLLGIHGLLPPRYKTLEEQLDLCKLSISRYTEDLNKYLYLNELHDRNEKLFFKLLSENVEQMMPIVYTPTVGLACQKFGLIYRRPRGLFITIHDRGHVYNVIKNWPEEDVRCIVVTDGERILGLGDLGACGMGIPVGKLALYTALGGIKPHQCLPITLDVGTNNKDLLEDPLYIGLRQNRIQGPDYDEFVDEFMNAVVKRYGVNCLIQFEDFGNHNAFRLLDKYRDTYCTFNDDIQGTGAAALAAILASSKLTKKIKISDNRFVFLGAGEAALGIASLITLAMKREGISEEEAVSKIWMVDIDGLLTVDRPKEKLHQNQKRFAKEHAPTKSLLDVVKKVKPSILIGVSAAGGAFTPEVLKTMAANNKQPVIFALSNPTHKAECTAQAAYENTDGRCIFCSGSPFGIVEYKGKKYKPGQGNNAYIFPGVALGVIASGIIQISDDIFIISAEELAEMITPEDLAMGSLYPPLIKIKDASFRIAMRIMEYAYKKNVATVFPEPKNNGAHIRSLLYDYGYKSILPETWKWPTLPAIKTKRLDLEVH